jgi:hypothetical protein
LEKLFPTGKQKQDKNTIPRKLKLGSMKRREPNKTEPIAAESKTIGRVKNVHQRLKINKTKRKTEMQKIKVN